MKSVIENITIALYGESHCEAMGVVIDGLPAGITIDSAFIQAQLENASLRERYRPSGMKRMILK